tara:strand:+ start:3428 stop:5080 length:1653 start_codon:yes stop_codon:yes gene_type:complete
MSAASAVCVPSSDPMSAASAVYVPSSDPMSAASAVCMPSSDPMSAASAANKKPNVLIWALQAFPEDMWASGKLCPQESTLILAHASKQVLAVLRKFSRRMAAEHTVPGHVKIESILHVLEKRRSYVELTSLHIDRGGSSVTNTLGRSGISDLAKFLMSQPAALATMKTLSISGNLFGSPDIYRSDMTPDHPIPSMIAMSTSLTQLSLRHNKLNRDDLKILSPKIALLTDLKRLDISQNSFGVHGIKRLVHAFITCKNITDVNLSSCNLMQKGASFIEIMGEAWQGITHLNISNNKLRNAGMESVAKTVQHMSLLVKLDISQNELAHGYNMNEDDDNVPYIVVYNRILPFLPKLRTFVCRSNSIRANGAAEIIQSMALNCQNLQNVDLSRNMIGVGTDGSYAKIVEYLYQCENLTTLDISCNHLGNWGGSKICQAVATSTSITELNLASNNLNLGELSENSDSIHRFLSLSTHLRVLDLCYNRLSLTGGENLLGSIVTFRGGWWRTGELRIRIHDCNLKSENQNKLLAYAKAVDVHGVIELVFPIAQPALA